MFERPSDWSAVGWERDPVPGDPAVVRQGGRNYIEVADRIKQSAESLRALEAGASTRAQSVTALLEQRDELVDGIWQVEGRYRSAGEALEAYASALDLAQSQSLTALYAARNAQHDLAEARQRKAFYQELAEDYDPGTEEPGAYSSRRRPQASGNGFRRANPRTPNNHGHIPRYTCTHLHNTRRPDHQPQTGQHSPIHHPENTTHKQNIHEV